MGNDTTHRWLQRLVQGGRVIAVALVLAAAAGCASNIPKAISEPPPDNPALRDARQQPAKYVGAAVRWGGTIASVTNRPDGTRIEIVGRELGRGGRPQESNRSDGRFLAQFEQFLDPVIYAEGRAITVAGTLQDPVAGTIGEFQYLFPVIDVTSHVLWEPLPERQYYPYDPFWYDPWYPYYYPYRYRPYGPYWGHPYW